MILLSTIRILKFAAQDFIRNFWLSIITVIILILSLFSINFLIVVGVISETAIDSVEEKIDLSLYLIPDAAEEDVGILKSELERLDFVQEVNYISKNQAMEAFQQKHSNDPEILETLRELGKNPLSPSLVVRAATLNEYEKIIDSLATLSKHTIIESRNFDDHKSLLESMQSITSRVRDTGILVSIIFIAITILVVFNSIRIAIYTHHKEIRIMKLVGASPWFIRSPFLAESVIYALTGIMGVIAIFYPFLHLLQPYIAAFFNNADSLDLIAYFNSNFFIIFGFQFLLAAIINMAASLIAVSKYAKR